MGWGQPTVGVGKRVRHSSEENDNNSEFTNSSNQSDDLGTHFTKRARDVSPRGKSDMTELTQREIPREFSGERRSYPSSSCSSSETQCSLEDLHYSKNMRKEQPIGESQNRPNDTINEEKHTKSNERDVLQESGRVANNADSNVEMHKSSSTTFSMSATLKGVRISSYRKGPRILTAFRGTRAPRNVFARRNSQKCARRKPSEMTTSTSEQDDEEDDDDCEMKGDGEECLSIGSSDVMLPDVCRRVVPAIRPSYFPYVPPYINFCLHDERVQTMPEGFKKHLKWRLSPITPIVVKKTVANSGFRLLRKTVEWGGEWGKHMKISSFRSALKDYQKLNHLPATFQIGRKDRLWKNVLRFMTKFGKEEFGFVPRTYILPQETKHLKAAWEATGNHPTPWIVKPPAAARGTGIRVINKWSQVPKKKPVIVQMYIANPYLINDRKFDLRLYVLVTSFHPLKVYMYNDGLVRFAPEDGRILSSEPLLIPRLLPQCRIRMPPALVKYSTRSNTVGDRYMHLTNYSINKNCELYTQNEDAEACHGHKWTLKTLWRYMEEKNVDTSLLKQKVEDIVIKTLISAEDAITAASTSMPNRYNGYELFGFDIIFDSELKPWLLEVNISPSLHSSSPLDLAVKGPLVQEVFNVVGFHLSPKLSPDMKKMLLKELDVELEQESPVFDKRLYCTMLAKEEKVKQLSYKNVLVRRDQHLENILEDITPGDLRQLITAEDELSQCEGFTRIFPSLTSHTYFPFFESPRYYNKLLDAWEEKYHENRIEGISRMIEMCRRKIHLEVPPVFRNPTCESPDSTLQSKLSNGDEKTRPKADHDKEDVKNSENQVYIEPDAESNVERNNESDGLSSSSSTASTCDISSSNSSLNTLNCHDEDRLSANNSNATTKVGEYIKGVCY